MEFMKFLKRLFLDCMGWSTEMNITGITEIDSAIPEYWAEGIIADGERESFWGSLSGGEGSQMPVIKKTTKLSSNGDLVHFTTIQQIMGTGVSGESVLKGAEQKLAIGTFTLSPELFRNAVSVTKKATKQANFDMIKQAGTALKGWMTRKMDNDAFDAILSSTTVTTLYASTKTAVGQLNKTDGDYFGPSDLGKLKLALQRQGAAPLMITKSNGRTIPIYGCVYGEVEEYRLSQNTTFNQTVKDIWERFSKGNDHPLIKGAVGMYGNMLLYPYYSILSLPQGTPLRPETLVAATCITAETTTLTVGTTSTATAAMLDDYTAFFASSGSLQIGSEIISYSTKTQNTFVTLTRSVSGTTAVQHVPDELITQRNVSTVIGFGAGALYRALPQDATPIGEKDDYGAQIGVGIEAYYGQKVFVDARRGKAQNVVIMKVYSENPGSV